MSNNENATAVSNSKKTAPQRGSLLVTIKPSTSLISAGGNFSLAVSITNPFDTPVSVGNVSTLLPVDLFDAAFAARLRQQAIMEQQIESKRERLLQQLSALAVEKKYTQEGWLRKYVRLLFSAALPRITGDAMADIASVAIARVSEIDWKRPELNRALKSVASQLEEPKLMTEQVLSKEGITSRVDKIIDSLEQKYEELQTEIDRSIQLQPGDAITKVFTLRTRKGITFRPSSYDLNILIAYDADGVGHTQSIPYSLNIEASMAAVILGAIIGSLLGFVAHQPDFLKWTWAVVPGILSTLILSGFAVIAFARKGGIQPIVSIQDFWGGLLTGFLVGYSGLQVLGNIFGASNA